ncbi:VOC family protein [Aliifodinibius salicampi]|uniref:VOC family protein n=1 Tax=Fodinibius salicampi TaxID=1920655 RepID=A0ABT3PUI7_9BACT|nr:VOC family protein [Fodinibius salicampi]MCW9711502.1 VOC family protein [Fodinibius salicampi]
MKIEHFAINVEQPLEVADWYVRHLGFEIVKQDSEPPYTTFLADDEGRVMIEVYNNPSDKVPDYSNMDPLILHLAMVSKDPAEDKKRLIEAGAKEVSDEILEDGSHLVMLRDPWGFSIQLCKRSTHMLRKGD